MIYKVYYEQKTFSQYGTYRYKGIKKVKAESEDEAKEKFINYMKQFEKTNGQGKATIDKIEEL